MNTIHGAWLDLNLLKVFDALVQESSVTKAAHKLHVTQSAISHGLKRLRELMDDELFVRCEGGVRPTPRALEIAPRIRQALIDVAQAMSPSDFDPATTRRKFALAATPWVRRAILPYMCARIVELAPSASLTVYSNYQTATDDLDSGVVDLAIGAFTAVPERFDSAVLASEDMVWVLNADDPLAKEPLTAETLASRPKVVLFNETLDRRAVDPINSDRGLMHLGLRDDAAELRSELEGTPWAQRQAVFHVPDVISAAAMVARCQVAALLPRSSALNNEFAGRLKVFDAPYDSPPVRFEMIWHRQHGSHPAVQWLRQLVVDAYAAIGTDPLARTAQPQAAPV